MRASLLFAIAAVKIFLLCVSLSVVETYPTTGITYRNLNLPKKCCVADYAFNEDLECVNVEPDKFDYTTHDVWQTLSQQPRQIVTIAFLQGLSCREDIGASNSHLLLQTYARDSRVSEEYCVEKMLNGTVVLAKCPGSGTELLVDTGENESAGMMTIKTTVITTKASLRENINQAMDCPNGTHVVRLWRKLSQSNISAITVTLCTIVVVIYMFVPELGKGIYNYAVLRHNICLLTLECFALLPNLCGLCDCPIEDDRFVIFLWIVSQFLTNVTGFWLNVICFDITISITRFRWMPDQNQRVQEEKRRLLIYNIFAWGGGLLSVVTALFFEYYPGIPEDFPLKPNYPRTYVAPGFAIYCYFFVLQLLTLFCNNVLFLFTTCKIMYIQRNTKLASRNRNIVPGRNKFLYLELYLIMGSLWFFGTLFSFGNYPLIMRICRVMQPIVWLVMLTTHKKLQQKIASKLRFVKGQETGGKLT